MCPKSRTKWHFSCERIPKFVWLRTWRSRTLLCSEHVQREGQRSVTRPDRAGRKSTVTQNATLYDRVEQKSISERTACQKTTTGGNNIASLDSNVKPVVNTAEISLTSNVFLNTALLLWGTITCPSPWKQFRNYPLQEQVRNCTFFFFCAHLYSFSAPVSRVYDQIKRSEEETDHWTDQKFQKTNGMQNTMFRDMIVLAE